MKTNRLLLMLLLFFTLFNCSNPNEIITQNKQELQQNETSFISLDDFKRTKTYKIFQKNQQKNSRTAAKGISNESYYVVGEQVLPTYLEEGTTYSLPLKSSDEKQNFQFIHRLFIEKTQNGNVSGYIIKISKDFKQAIIKPINISNNSQTIIGDNPQGGLRNCSHIYISVTYPCPCEGHYSKSECNCSHGPVTTNSTLDICYGEEPDLNQPKISFGNHNQPAQPITSYSGKASDYEIYLGPSKSVADYIECVNGSSELKCNNLPKLSHYNTGENLQNDIKKQNFKKFTGLFIFEKSLLNWVNAPQNSEFVNKTIQFCNNNNWSNTANEFAYNVVKMKSQNPNIEIDFNIEPYINSNNLNDYTYEIKRMTAYLKVRGARELCEYIESLTPHFNSFTIQEVKDIYNLKRKQYLALKGQYMMAIYGTVAEQAYPFIVYAVTEATLGTALPLLSRIPVSMVTKGAKLEKMIEKVMKMGTPGIKPHVKIFKTHLNPERIAKELFNSLTKDRIGAYGTPKPGVITANMGNGNFITYRTVSSTGFEATIQFNFNRFLINGKPLTIKFTK